MRRFLLPASATTTTTTMIAMRAPRDSETPPVDFPDAPSMFGSIVSPPPLSVGNGKLSVSAMFSLLGISVASSNSEE